MVVIIERSARTARPPRVTALAVLTPVDNPGAEVRLEMLDASVLEPANPRWSEMDRPRRQNVLRYDGKSVQRQTFTAMFSGTPGDTGELSDVTTATVALHHLLGQRGADEPPLLRLSGPLYGIGPNDRWQVEKITPTAPWRRESDARTGQVTYEVSLVQYLATDVLVATRLPESPAAASNARAEATAAPSATPSTTSSTRRYVVRAGDTLTKIAASQLGNAGRWREISALNGLRDPNVLRIGMELKLP